MPGPYSLRLMILRPSPKAVLVRITLVMMMMMMTIRKSIVLCSKSVPDNDLQVFVWPLFNHANKC
jgi:hypothetical protein